MHKKSLKEIYQIVEKFFEIFRIGHNKIASDAIRKWILIRGN